MVFNHFYGSRHNALMTDAYQLTMTQAAYNLGKQEEKAVFDVFFRKLPWDGGFAVFAGAREIIDFIDHFHFSKEDIDYLANNSEIPFSKEFLDYLSDFAFTGSIYSMQEGSIIFPNEPIMRVHGTITEIRLLETTLLTIVNSASLWVTKAARLRLATGKGNLMEFGMRRAQSPMAAYNGAVYGYMGGFDATSNMRAGMDFGIPIAGTQAHNWIQQFPTELEAFQAYAKAYPATVILLVDTYDSLKSGVPNAIKVFTELQQHGNLPDTYGIRLDSGDLAFLSKEARKQLDAAGFDGAIIAGSNDLDEYLIESIRNQGGKITFWGVGTNYITCAGNPALGAVLKLAAITENDKKTPKIKLSNQPEKITLPGIKQVHRLVDEEGMFCADIISCSEEKLSNGRDYVLIDPEHKWRKKIYKHGTYQILPMLQLIISNGETKRLPGILEVKKRVENQIESIWPEYKRFVNPERYKVNLTPKLSDLKANLINEEIKRVGRKT